MINYFIIFPNVSLVTFLELNNSSFGLKFHILNLELYGSLIWKTFSFINVEALNIINTMHSFEPKNAEFRISTHGSLKPVLLRQQTVEFLESVHSAKF